VVLPRGNGKSGLAASLALYELMGTEGHAPQVVCVASDERQARIVFDSVRRMVQAHPDLSERVTVYRDRLEVPYNDGELIVLPAEPDALQGYRPTAAIVDELHVVRPDCWEAITLAAGKTEQSLTLAISTPAGDRDGLMWQLVEHGRTETDQSFRLIEYAAPDGCNINDEGAWKIANPALGDFLSIDALRANLATARPASFRRYRLGQWVGADGSWMPHDSWASCAHPTDVDPFTRIVAFFDGSASGDSTALVGATVSETPHLFVLGHWANPGDPRWRVPRREVLDRVREVSQTYELLELAADPWGWRIELEQLNEDLGGRVVEFPTNVVSRMGPATDLLYSAVHEHRVTHDGDPELASHVAHAIAKATAAGDVIYKDARNSPRKIDLAVCAIGAHARALWHYQQSQTTELGVWFA